MSETERENRILLTLIKIVLSNILNLIELEDRFGKKLRVFGFKPKGSRYRKMITRNLKEEAVLYQSINGFKRLEPRIGFIKNTLEMILSCIDLTDERDNVVYPYSFRLKDLKHWLVPLHLNDFLCQLAWPCTVHCSFCYQKGTPSRLRTKRYLSIVEIRTRLKYYNLKKGIGLTFGTTFDVDENLENPYIFEILQTLRAQDKNIPFSISTNGATLTEAHIRKLADLQPVQLHLSLNSANPLIRQYVMHDPFPDIAINSVKLLNRYEIPFVLSCVMWPTIPFTDIAETINYAHHYKTLFVVAWLPGYTKYLPGVKSFNTPRFWNKALKFLDHLRDDVSTPIIYPPASMLHESNEYQKVDSAYVHGVIRYSPAYNAGIKKGDLVVQINGTKVDGRESARRILNHCRDGKIDLLLKREDRPLIVTLRRPAEKEYRYPYTFQSSRFIFPFGIVMLQGFDHRYLLDIENYVRLYSSKNILILSSKIIQPTLEYLLKKYDIAKRNRVNIFTEIPRNLFFGGNIIIGDLFVTNDFVAAIRKWQRKHQGKPDLILIPSSPFSSWGRDLTGEVNLSIERITGIPTQIIYNERIWA